MKSSLNYPDTFKIPALPSNPTKITRKKCVTFKKSLIKCPGDTSSQVETPNPRESIHINISNNANQKSEVKNNKNSTSLGSLTGLFVNKTPLKQNFILQESCQNLSQNYSTKFKSKKDLLLEMFKQNIAHPPAQSVNSIIFDDPVFFSFGKALIQKNLIKNNLVQECPFQVVERQIEKSKEIRKKKQPTGLQKLTKKLLNDLKTQEKFGNQAFVMRQRYLSYFHSRVDKKPFRELSMHRKSLQESHEHTRSKSIDYEISRKLSTPKMINCVNHCTKLINFCKEVQKEQTIKKEIKIFTVYNKKFVNKCEKKFKTIDKIKKAI